MVIVSFYKKEPGPPKGKPQASSAQLVLSMLTAIKLSSQTLKLIHIMQYTILRNREYMLCIVLEELSHGCKCMVVRQRIHVVYSSRGTFPWL